MRVLAALALAVASMACPAAAQTLAVVNARVVDGNRDDPDMTIVVRGGRIVSVASGAAPPEGMPVVDAGGRTVTPALAAAATQIGLVGIGGEPETQNLSVSSGTLGAALDVARAIDPSDLTIQQARSQGVASAMVFPDAGAGVFAGLGVLLDLDPARPLVRQRQAAMFATSAGTRAAGSRAAAWALIRNALAEAKKPAAQATGPRGDGLSPADVEALRPVVAGRIPLAITAHREADIREAIALSRDLTVRVVVIGGTEAWRLADALAAAKVGVVLDPLDDLPFTYDAIGARRDNAAILARSGVAIAFMASAQGVYLSYNVGPALREVAGLAAANGLPRADALQAITTGAARVWTGTAGQGLAVGAPADMVIWDGDPLEPSTAPARVILGGRDISLVTRQTLLRDRYDPRRAGAATPPPRVP